MVIVRNDAVFDMAEKLSTLAGPADGKSTQMIKGGFATNSMA